MSKIAPCANCIEVLGDGIVMCPHLIIEDGEIKCGRKGKELSGVIKSKGETV